MRTLLTPMLGVIAMAASAAVVQAGSSENLPKLQLEAMQPKAKSSVYIVQLKGDPVLSFEGGVAGLKATKPSVGKKMSLQSADVKKYAQHLDDQHSSVLQAVGASSNKIYDYRYAFNGFAARMTREQASQLKKSSDVVQVWEDELLQPQTNTSPEFLGVTRGRHSWKKGIVGEDIIIGVIDTGIHPDHPSLNDEPTHKRGNRGRLIEYGPLPDSWSGTGCVFGNIDMNPNDTPFTCNNKLIKADYFVEGYGTDDLINGEFLSARDSDGHGTHTATTAAGNYGVEAILDGEPQGVVSGIAPRARVAVYKVCWESSTDGGCASSDSMAAIDQAVADGVDVINFSIGGSSTSFNGPDDIAFLHAANAGVWVATSQGNSGPGAGTTGTPAGVPWITSVGAAQDDQVFATALQVIEPAELADDYVGLEGSGPVSLEDAGDITDNLIPATPANGCSELTNPEQISDNVALIVRGGCGFATKYNNAAAAGATAVVVYNDGTTAERIDPIRMGGLDGVTIPGIMIGFNGGNAIVNSINAGEAVTGTVGPSISIPQINRIAGFSSRGPNGGAPDIIKPDVAAPGVAILAGETLFPNDAASGGQLFQSINGTSMASPHVAGVFALLKQANPDWTPAMARSALMTTARQDLKKTFGEKAADAFDIGSGFIVPEKAFKPGLVYDADLLDYIAFSCGNNVQLVDDATCDFIRSSGKSTDGSDLNLPSIAIGELAGKQTITRTVTAISKGRKTYRVNVDAPSGVQVSVEPEVLRLREGQSASYQVTFTNSNDVALDEWVFGSLTWSHGKRYSVRSAIAVQPVLLSAPSQLLESGVQGSSVFDVAFGYTGNFVATVDGLTEAVVSVNSIEDGATNESDAFDIPEGVTVARFSTFDADVGSGDGSTDLDIQVYGPDSAGFPLAGESAGGGASEDIVLDNPAAGQYIVVVKDFASEEGPTAYKVFNFNQTGTDAGNTTINVPSGADFGAHGKVEFEWSELKPGTRYLGVVSYGDGASTLRNQTQVMVNTQ